MALPIRQEDKSMCFGNKRKKHRKQSRLMDMNVFRLISGAVKKRNICLEMTLRTAVFIMPRSMGKPLNTTISRSAAR